VRTGWGALLTVDKRERVCLSPWEHTRPSRQGSTSAFDIVAVWIGPVEDFSRHGERASDVPDNAELEKK